MRKFQEPAGILGKKIVKLKNFNFTTFTVSYFGEEGHDIKGECRGGAYSDVERDERFMSVGTDGIAGLRGQSACGEQSAHFRDTAAVSDWCGCAS